MNDTAVCRAAPATLRFQIIISLADPGEARDILKDHRAPVVTSDKEEKHVILPTTLNFPVRSGKLRIYTLQNSPEVF